MNMVKEHFKKDVAKSLTVMTTDCNVENDSNQGHEVWGDTPDIEVECKSG